MERYLSPAKIAEHLDCSKRHAYDIIYQLPHLENPLRVSERVLARWIEQNTVYPVGKPGRRTA